MLNISITKDITTVENTDLYCKWTLKTSEFFGVVYANLEQHFPNFECESLASRIISHTMNVLSGKEEDAVKIFGCTELGETLYNLIYFIGDKRILAPTLKDIETMRIDNRMTANYLPVSLGDKDSMRFEGLKTVTQVMVAALYYYAYHDYKLVRCKHCGTWFATKTLKQEYCDRISPCFNVIVKGKKPLSCEQAVRNIFQKCGRIKNRIETKANQTVSAQLHRNSFIDRFQRECEPLYLSAKESPTVQNLTNYYNFLKQTDKEKGWLA